MRVLAVAIAFGALELGCSSWVCRNKVVSESLRPGGPYRAVVFNRDCWTRRASAHVSLLGINAISDRNTGNILVVSAPDEVAPRLEVRWIDRGTLQILRPSEVIVSSSVANWEGIQILLSDKEIEESPAELTK